MAALAGAHQDGKIGRDPQGQDGPWRERQRQLYQHNWVVYAKTPLGGPAQVLEYLSRYTHRTAISNERIRGVSEREVAFVAAGANMSEFGRSQNADGFAGVREAMSGN